MRRSDGKKRGRRDRANRGQSTEADNGPHRVPGLRAVLELLQFAPRRVQEVLAVAGRAKGELSDAAAAAGVPLTIVDHATLSKRAGDADPRGVLALAQPAAEVELDDILAGFAAASESTEGTVPARRILLALDGVLDPGNLGALMRSAEFFGVAAVLWPRDRAATVTPLVVRASVGASERLALCRVTNLARALDSCKAAGAWIMGTVPEGGRPLAELLAEDALPDPLVVVLGGEERGIRRLTRERCDFLATIPRSGALASLNVSAAGAVVLAAVTSSV